MKLSVKILLSLATSAALASYNRNPKALNEKRHRQRREILDAADDGLKKPLTVVQKRTDDMFDHYQELVDGLSKYDIQYACTVLYYRQNNNRFSANHRKGAELASNLHFKCQENAPTVTMAPDTHKPCGVSDDLKDMIHPMNRRSLSHTKRIVGGMPVGGCHVAPWQARVRKYGKGVTGGSIISDLHILTAAHVVDEKKPFDVDVVIGDYNRVIDESSEQTAKVKSVKIHPEYNATTIEADIALLTLWLPLRFSNDNPCIAPVCMDPNFHPYGDLCIATGWGTNECNGVGELLEELHMAVMPTYPGDVCDDLFHIPLVHPIYIPNKDTQICAGYVGKGGVATCQGDSGGPLVCLNPATDTFVQAGVSSNGIGCGEPEFPKLYSSVAGFYNWITEKMQED